MPKSKREKIVRLTKTKPKGKEHKETLVCKIQDCCEKFKNIFVISAKNLQNELAKELRDDWVHSRMFFGKNTVMAHAIGIDRGTEIKRNMHKISLRLRGQTGLLFTNLTEEEVLKWFAEFKRETFASAGDIAPDTVILKAGEMKNFQHTMEERFRSLGLPTELNAGVIKLLKDFKVCEKDKEMTATQAKILKLLNRKLFTFEVTVECMWSDEKYKAFTVAQDDLPAKKNTKANRDSEKCLEDEMVVEEGADEEDEDEDDSDEEN